MLQITTVNFGPGQQTNILCGCVNKGSDLWLAGKNVFHPQKQAKTHGIKLMKGSLFLHYVLVKQYKYIHFMSKPVSFFFSFFFFVHLTPNLAKFTFFSFYPNKSSFCEDVTIINVIKLNACLRARVLHFNLLWEDKKTIFVKTVNPNKKYFKSSRVCFAPPIETFNSDNKPSHEIMVLFILSKLIHQMRMRSHPVRLDGCFLVGPIVYFHTSCVWTAKALARLRRCVGSPEPSLVA